MKEIVLWQIDGNTSAIGVCFHGSTFWRQTGLAVRQEQDGTKVWRKATGEEIKLPRERYTLSSEAGLQDFGADLDALGLLAMRKRDCRTLAAI